MWKIESPLENRNGTLYIEDCNTMELADTYDTPLYVMSEARIRANYRRLRDTFSNYYKDFKLYYAVKANNNLSVLSILRQEGANADCSNPAEIFLAKAAGFTSEQLLYTGNYNRDDEFVYACDSGATVNLDDITHIDRIVKFGMPPRLSFRINPGMGDGKYKELVFAGPDAKFGVPEKDAVAAYTRARDHGFERFGLHMMAGSCVLDPAYFEAITERLLDIAGAISQKAGISFEFINVGGGFGVPYAPDEPDLDLETTAQKITAMFDKKLAEYSMKKPTLFIEPGRYIACDAGILLTRVHAQKNAYKKFIGVDAGMHTILRPALYDAYHAMYAANKLNVPERETVNLCGPICENTDILAKDRAFPPLESGDVVALLNAGAYGYSMSSQYNSRPRAAEVLVSGKKHEIIRERETFTDLTLRQRVPSRLLK